MKIFILAVLAGITLVMPVLAQDTAMSYRSDHAGKRYDFTVTHAQLQLTPDWAENAPNPPLSPRKALALAQMDLATFLLDAAQWKYPKITLQEVGAPHKWIYLIEFSGPLPPNISDGPVDRMTVLVLMNGIAIRPVIKPSSFLKQSIGYELLH